MHKQSCQCGGHTRHDTHSNIVIVQVSHLEHVYRKQCWNVNLTSITRITISPPIQQALSMMNTHLHGEYEKQMTIHTDRDIIMGQYHVSTCVSGPVVQVHTGLSN